MNEEELGYYLYMSFEESMEKDTLYEYEKVNLEINPFLVGEESTKDEEG